MPAAKTSAYYPDHKTQHLGHLSKEDALARFDDFPWAELVLFARELELQGENCVSADLTFLVAGSHLTARVTDDPNFFDLNVAIPRRGRIFGIFGWTKFFEVKNLPAHAAREAIDAFFSKIEVDQISYFTRLRDSGGS